MYDKPYHEKPLAHLSFLVTGGGGFIGSNLVEYLLKYKAGKVRVLDNFSSGYLKNIVEFKSNAAFELVEGDIRDAAVCMAACENIDIILHQAALGSVPRSIKEPAEINSVNVDGFVNMIVAAKESGVKRFVYATSSSVYGDSKELPKVEERVGRPLSPYAVTKYVNELYAEVFAATYGIETIGLRYFNVFGPKQDIRGAYAAVIPLLIDAQLQSHSPVINGDGTQTRDFTFVENCVQANIKAALVENPEAVNKVYNIGAGDRTSLLEVLNMLKTATGVTLEPVHGPERVGDIKDSWADISRAKYLLGYKPEVAVREGLQKTFKWFNDNQQFIYEN
ncbi:SDR family oxidoreductase [Pontibacter silvestris]|uniref:SDR family oxidoreductase n=1 Tax=Pontibacter silvestris TaxID=2305183 RepID=A0ABW4WWZ4_9BACT|nr:SDR family oxidoreductase [Pontibacter silvestris]MCC9136606.1 SDR family oxidoreductase [Pontibacter silvestris]